VGKFCRALGCFVLGAVPLFSGAALGSAYSDFNAGISFRNRDQADDAIRYLSQALNEPGLFPRYRATAFFDRAQMYFSKKMYGASIDDLNSTLMARPDFTPAYEFRAWVYEIIGKPELAFADYDAIVRQHPDHLNSYVQRAGAYRRYDRYADAIADYNTIVTIRPDWEIGYRGRAEAYAATADFLHADADIEKAHTLASKDDTVLQSRAMIRAGEGRIEDALDDLDDVVDNEPDNVFAILNKATLQWSEKKYDKALRTLKPVTKDDGTNPYAAIWQEIIYLSSGKDDASFNAITNKVAADTDWPGPVVRYYRGEISLTELENAAEVGIARDRNGRVCEANFYSAEWLYRHGDSLSAKPLLQSAASHCPPEYTEFLVANQELKIWAN
jgi:tetratricopeptide (TPR) repeat protein